MYGSIRFGGGGQGHMLARYKKNSNQVQDSLRKLSTGKRINSAKDDPAGLIGATQIKSELAKLQAEQRVATMASHQAAISESVAGQVGDMMQQMYGLVSMAADGLLSDEQRNALQIELEGAIDSISRVQSYTAKYGGEQYSFDTASLAEFQAGGSMNLIDGDIGKAQEFLKSQLSGNVHARAELGAKMKMDETLAEVRADQIINNQEALSQIEDLDFASEISKFRQSQTLVESSLIAMQYYQNTTNSTMRSLLSNIDVQA